MPITHSVVVVVPDDGSPVGSNAWNADHVVTVNINAQVGVTYMLQASDNDKVITLNNALSITLTCPAGLGVGFSCVIIQLGAGQVGVIAGGGATLNSYLGLVNTAGQYAAASLISPVADTFILSGQLA